MPGKEEIFLSILIPTWNRCESVIAAVKSVGPITGGTEIIVVDDGSEESIALRLREGLRSFPQAKIFRNKVNLGMVKNWNACISHATGAWLGILCDDDCYCEGSIERAIALMKRTTAPSLIIQDPSLNVDVLECPWGRETVESLRLPIVSGNFWHSAIVKEIGGFDERFIYSADAEYWPRIACRFPVIKVKANFAVYKKHATNYMWDTWRKPDFLKQMEALNRAVTSYTVNDRKTIEKKIESDLWSGLLTIISATFLVKGKADIFLRYFPEACSRARGFKRKACLVKDLLIAFASRCKTFARALFGGVFR